MLNTRLSIQNIPKNPLVCKLRLFIRTINGTTKNQGHSDDVASFQHEFNRNRINLTPFQKVILGIGSSIVSLYNPRRVDMLACCAEIVCISKLKNILEDMMSNSEGYQIIRDKPRIFTGNLMEKISNSPCNTFGWAIGKFLCDNNVNSDSETPAKFISDPELAYVMIRCRQIHDYLHVLLNVPTNRGGEIAIKWIEAINLGLPTAYVAAIAGSAYIAAKDREKFIKHHLPLAIHNGNLRTKFYNVYWERKLDFDLENLRNELGVEVFS